MRQSHEDIELLGRRPKRGGHVLVQLLAQLGDGPFDPAVRRDASVSLIPGLAR